MPEAPKKPTTLRTLRQMADAGTPFACLTCYDATTARWLEQAGIPLLLVGDTAAEMILGLDRTLEMPLDVLIALTAAVKRGAPRTVVMGDMPFLSYQASPDDAVRNAGRFLVEGKADIVKLEADASFAPLVERMVRAGIAVCGHVGSKPQHSTKTGGYSSAGRTAADAAAVLTDAQALERAGCSLLLVEAVPDEVAAILVERAAVPVIGIGAGTAPDGQILVLQDLLGLSPHRPRFAEPTANLGEAMRQGAETWVKRVAARAIGGQSYPIAETELKQLRAHARSEQN